MSYITVEDINTILLKYCTDEDYGVTVPMYDVPEITFGTLYRGNINKVEDVVSLPENIEYTVYFENKPVSEIDLPRDYEDNCRLRVVTKSYYPYVNTDVFIEVPVETKHLTTLADLNTYSYGYIDTLVEINGEITNDIYIECKGLVQPHGHASLTDCNLSINGSVTFDGNIACEDSKIINDGRLEFKNADSLIVDGGGSNDYFIVNHFELYMRDINRLDVPQPFVLNSNYFAMENNIVSILNLQSAPVIYNTGEMVILNNSFTFNNNRKYNNFAVCLFRADNVDVDKLLIDNSIIYDNITANIEETEYNINGTGVCYAKIDDDTIYIKDLEVTENE